MNLIVRIILAQVLEAVYFSLFMIKGKNIKDKRILFVCLMIVQYLLLKQFIKFDVGFQLIYIFTAYLDLKILYKDKAQITDIFLFMIASIILIIVSVICGLIEVYLHINHNILLIINRIIIFTILYFLKDKINNIYKNFYKYWNRHNNNGKIRSLTLRNISVIIFNLMFYVINFCMIYAKFMMK